MAAKEVVTILGFTATADEWTAWSAVGTVGATMIALFALMFPLVGAWRRRVQAKRDKHALHRRILNAVDKARALFKQADEMQNYRRGDSLTRYGALARYKSTTLRMLAAKPDVSTIAIDCALGAAEMLDRIVVADEYMRNADFTRAANNMKIARLIEVGVNKNAEEFDKAEKLDRHAGDAVFDEDQSEGA